MAQGGVEGVLTTIAACGGVGAIIDFWIGRKGDKRVRGWMEGPLQLPAQSNEAQ
jgi:hypothetical protein